MVLTVCLLSFKLLALMSVSTPVLPISSSTILKASSPWFSLYLLHPIHLIHVANHTAFIPCFNFSQFDQQDLSGQEDSLIPCQ